MNLLLFVDTFKISKFPAENNALQINQLIYYDFSKLAQINGILMNLNVKRASFGNLMRYTLLIYIINFISANR